MFAAWPWKWGSSRLTVVQALHKWLISISLKTTQDSNLQFYTSVKPEHYILARNDVISYFRSCRDFSITFQWASKKLTLLERIIQVLHFLSCNLIDIFAPWFQKRGWNLPTDVCIPEVAAFDFLENCWSWQSTDLHRHIPGRFLYPHRKWCY